MLTHDIVVSMAIFKIKGFKVAKLKINRFKNEKDLQIIFEKNLEEIFGIKFLESEYSTTKGGRIDTLGLDEDGSPVIIEYKQNENGTIISQGLSYLDWLIDHKGDFEVLVQKRLGKFGKVNWDAPRIILVAQSFNHYDKSAVNRISAKIELKRYIIYEDGLLFVEDEALPSKIGSQKNKIQLYKEYTIDSHLNKKPKKVKELLKELQGRILKLDLKIKEKVLKHYIAYEFGNNFVEIQIQSSGLKVYLDILKRQILDPKRMVKDCSSVGHWATGNSFVKLSSLEDIEYVMSLVKQSYERRL